jgi:peptidoglycan-N-acetylglucosamine deacetylase
MERGTTPSLLAPVVALLLLLGVVGSGLVAGQPARAVVARRDRYPVLRYGSRGGAVRTAQALLRQRGYPVPVTGFYGPLTTAQVRRFQAARGIRRTGKVGPLTWAALLRRQGGGGAGGGGAGGVVYLTFDDGPSPVYTPQVLDLLGRYGARATFFVVGRNVQAYPALVRQELRGGHGLGNHTFTHADLRRLGPAGFASEVGRTTRALRQATGAAVRCLRPPYRGVDATVERRAGALGLRVVLWNVDPRDWSRPGAAMIAARVVDRTRAGDVVLLHDGGGDRAQTVAALRRVLPALAARGFRFAALCRG